MLSRRQAALCCVVAVTLAAGPAAAAGSPLDPPAVPATAATAAESITLVGRGHGHGVGLSQDGALALGRQGRSAPQILGTFYRGTSYGSARGSVRVAVASAGQHDTVRVRLPGGGVVRSGSSGVEVPRGGSVDVAHEADGYRVALVGAPKKNARARSKGPEPYAILSAEPVQVVATGRSYRGTLSLIASGPDLRLVNTLDVETYLLGLGEVRDSSWPLPALQAQVVAARTYALRARGAGNPVFDVWDDDRSQVYLGVSGEYALLARAVQTTGGQVLTYGGALAATLYSSSAGGVSATPEEGFGPGGAEGGDAPYLRSAPYPTADPQPWQEVFALPALAARLSYPGTVTGLTVVGQGPSGRALTVRVEGSAGPRDLQGVEVERRLGLRSTLFEVVGSIAAAPSGALAPRVDIPALAPPAAVEAPAIAAPPAAPSATTTAPLPSAGAGGESTPPPDALALLLGAAQPADQPDDRAAVVPAPPAPPATSGSPPPLAAAADDGQDGMGVAAGAGIASWLMFAGVPFGFAWRRQRPRR